ncbi:MAG: MFS transporter [Actinophytocola sp.]|nr:MFS transporter [Actinophytocola sp.]
MKVLPLGLDVEGRPRRTVRVRGWEVVRNRLRAVRGRTLRSLAVRNYRIFLTGHGVSVIGTWMQRVAQDWLVLELTDSAFAVGVATGLQFLPMLLFGLWGGLLVDRFDRRRIIMLTQTVSSLLAAALATLVLTGVVRLEMVYVLAFALGLVTVVDSPARHTFATEMVDPADYVNAHALSSTVHNTGRLVGPAVAGLLIAWVGPGIAFAINSASFLAVLVGLALMDPAALRKSPAVARAPGRIREGLRYVWHHPELRACMILVAVVALFGQNFRVVLPLLARDDLGGGPATYGWLTSALGLGAVLGALVTAAREHVTAWSLLMATFAFGLVNLLAAGSPGLTVALIFLAFVGAAHITFNTLARTLLQLGTDAQMRGRVAALHGLVFMGSQPVGGPLLGWLCEMWGARAGLVIAGVTALIAGLALISRLRHLRKAPPDVV